MTDVLTPGDGKSPWTNSLPLKWPSKPLKYLVSIDSRKLPENTRPEEVLRYIDIGAVNALGEIQEIEVTLFENAPSRARRLPVRGDSIISTVRTYLRAIAYIGNTEGEGRLVCSTGFAVLSPAKFVHPKFLYYCVRSSGLIEELVARSTGVSYPAISPSGFSALPLPLPPFQLQRVIADFLDRKTAAIDELIRKKERLIELLAEKRQALITQAVTKGLDPNVPMKDSGIEWLGEIPAHWDLLPLKRISPKQHGRLIVSPNNYIEDEGIPIVFGFNIRDGQIDLDTIRYIGFQYGERFRNCTVAAGDLLCVRVGAPGETAVVPSELDGCHFASTMQIVQHPSFYSPWLAHVFNSRVVRHQIGLVQYGAAQEQINVGDAVRFRIPTPPLKEQVALSKHLDGELSFGARGIALVSKQISRLREYRQALISTAVTGQLDIPGEPTP